MGKKKKFKAPDGLSLKDFQDNLAGIINRKNIRDRNNSKIRVRRNIIKQIYNSFINNSVFLEGSNQQEMMLEILKSIIKKAIEYESGNDKNNFIKHCKRLLGIKDKLNKTVEHVQDKLNEASDSSNGETEYYDKFRVNGGTKFLKKFLRDVVSTGNIAYSLGNMDIGDLSEEEVGDLEDELNNFLDEVNSNIEKIINYTPLLKVKNDIKSILTNIQQKSKNVNDNNIDSYIKSYEITKNSIKDEEMVKIKRGITKDIFKPWGSEYNKVCDTLLTLETERTFTRHLRHAVQKVAWFGNKLYSFLKVIKP